MYKRQVQYCPKEKGIINGVPLQKKRTGTKKEGKGAESKADQAYFRNGSGSGPGASCHSGCEPVSYTHLDVYKRQHLLRCP